MHLAAALNCLVVFDALTTITKYSDQWKALFLYSGVSLTSASSNDAKNGQCLFVNFSLVFLQSTQGMRSSKFCLHPAGDTPSSCRLFDAIVSHCVPVIVSDQIELPYEDEIDYSRFSIFFSVKEALTPGYMVDQLRLFPKERWIEMWKQLRTISHHYEFHYPPQKEDAVDMLWREIKHKLPGVKLAVHRNRRLKIPDWWGRRR